MEKFKNGDGAMRNVLFLCTGNSARSIMAEALLRNWGEDNFGAWSAGSRPAGAVNPIALEMLAARDISAEGLRSKSWDEFGAPGAPVMDLVITVCDNAANESCPILPGSPIRLHWGLPDPVAAQGDEEARKAAFATVCDKLEQRISQLVTIPFEDRDPESVLSDLEAIAAMTDATAADLAG